VGELVKVPKAVWVSVGVPEGVLLEVADGVPLLLGLPVGVDEGDWEAEAVLLGVALEVPVMLGEAV
jgi:hypothetical protein